MNDQHWQWSIVAEHWPLFRDGAAITIVLTLLVIAIGGTLGTALACLLSSRRPVVHAFGWMIYAPLRAVRTLPVLVLLTWLHFGFAPASGWLHRLLGTMTEGLTPHTGGAEETLLLGIAHPAFATALVGLSIVLAATVAGIVHNGVRGIPDGVIDGARSLGMGPCTRMRRLILPETFRVSVPALANAAMDTLRYTTLAAFIGVGDLLNVIFTAAASTERKFELVTVLAMGYMAVLVPATLLTAYVERSRWLQRKA